MPTDTSAATPLTEAPSQRPSWGETLRVYLEPASLRMLALGFSAGLPLLLVLGTLSFRLREAGLDRTTIGYLSWVGLAYGFKWCWAPLVDRLPIPLLTRSLGRRRSWLLVSQFAIMAALVGMALADPRTELTLVVWCALAVAFASATQDIALDAFRIESADVRHQGALAATYQTGYRVAMIWAGAGVLWLAARAEIAPAVAVAGAAPGVLYQQAAWTTAYLVMAVSMLVGVLTVLFTREPARVELPPSNGVAEWLKSALVEPFADFLKRYGKQALLILALIGVYRISDVVMGIMANPFYVDMGYTKDEVAAVTKVYGIVMTLVGAFPGRRHVAALGCDARADAGRRAVGGEQPAVRVAGWPWPRRDGADRGDLGRQPERRRGLGCVHRLPFQPDQREVLGHAVRAVQLHDAAGTQVAGRLLWRVRGCVRLRHLLHRHRVPRIAGSAAGVVGDPAHARGDASGGFGGSAARRALISAFCNLPRAVRGRDSTFCQARGHL